MLRAEKRHIGEHQQCEHRRRRRFGGKDVLIGDAHKWLLRQWRSQVAADALDDPLRGSTKSRISLVTRLRERRSRGLAQNGATATGEIFISRTLGAELEQPLGIFVLRQQAEQDAARE